ncbi:hypothetical protein AB1L30_04955 [Bremerella sp. JC817]|uniref:hypothetical protein n=1 Tax=Bremerella sp. JC817 TaxID=3231756 RepID=UPI003458D87C
MKIFENEDLESFQDRDSGAVFADIEFRNCYFRSCIVSVTKDPALRSYVKNVTLRQCSQRGCAIYSGIFENVVVDGLKTNTQLVQVWGAVFKHVVLRGNIDRLMISPNVDVKGERPAVQVAFDQANSEYYRHVDWALDISEGAFKDLWIQGVPAHLIRRNPESQVVVTREKAMAGEWRELSLHEQIWSLALRRFLEGKDDAVVLVAPKRHRKFRRYVEDLRTLQQAGVAEPD